MGRGLARAHQQLRQYYGLNQGPAGSLTSAQRSAIAAGRLRDSRGRFAYEGGRKKPPKKVRRKKDVVNQTVSKAIKTQAAKIRATAKTEKQLAKKAEQAAKKVEKARQKQIKARAAKLIKARRANKTAVIKPNLPNKELTQLKKQAKKEVGFRMLPVAKKTAGPGVFAIEGGRIRSWADNPANGRAIARFRTERDFNYSVNIDGKNIRLNANTKTMIVQGETFKGIPGSFKVLRDKKPETLANELVDHVSQSEAWRTSREKPYAPAWQAKAHGHIDKEYLGHGSESTRNTGAAKYGTSQLHHINQHYRKEVLDAMDGYRSGKLSADEAKAIIKDHLYNEDGKVKLKLEDIDKRAYVVLPKYAHEAGTILFEANHPKVLDPFSEGAKLIRPGIPEKGPGGREDFNANIKPTMWAEWHKQQGHAITAELNRRILKGEITANEAHRLIEQARLKRIEQQNKLAEEKKALNEKYQIRLQELLQDRLKDADEYL